MEIAAIPIARAPALIARDSTSIGRSNSFSRSSRSTRSSSSSKSSRTKSGTSSKSSTTTSKGRLTAKPGSTIKTPDGRSVTSSAAKSSNTKHSQSSGVVGDNGYQPKFTSGFNAPTGSVISYPQHSFIDYLPWIYLFSGDSPLTGSGSIVLGLTSSATSCLTRATTTTGPSPSSTARLCRSREDCRPRRLTPLPEIRDPAAYPVKHPLLRTCSAPV